MTRLRHEAIHEKHKGHETMHAEMVLVLLGTLIVSQIVLVIWKAKHFKSFQSATMLAMWLIPIGISVHLGHTRFICTWLFSPSSPRTCASVPRAPHWP